MTLINNSGIQPPQKKEFLKEQLEQMAQKAGWPSFDEAPQEVQASIKQAAEESRKHIGFYI